MKNEMKNFMTAHRLLGITGLTFLIIKKNVKSVRIMNLPSMNSAFSLFASKLELYY